MLIRPPRTVTSRLNVYIGGATCALLVATVWVSYYSASSVVESQTNSEALKQVHYLAEKMDEIVSKIAEIPTGIAVHQQNKGAQPDKEMVAYLAAILGQTRLDEVQSVYIAYERKSW